MDSHMMDAGGEDDFEWEYEYHEKETEDFYVILDIPAGKKVVNPATVDLFAPMPQTDPKKPKKPRSAGIGKGRGRGSRTRGGADAAAPVELHSAETAATQNDSGDDEPATAPPVQQPAQTNKGRVEPLPTEFQLMDLDSDNPIISYGGTLYSCQWATSIGSDLLFKKRPSEVDTNQQVLHSFEEYDLIAISAAKLIASPAAFQRRQPTSATVTHVDKTKYDSETKALQADFIKRLADLKTQMGQPIGSMLNSVLPIHSTTVKEIPESEPSSSAPPVSRPSTRGGRGPGSRGGVTRQPARGRGRVRGTASPDSTNERSPALPQSPLVHMDTAMAEAPPPPSSAMTDTPRDAHEGPNV
ncbi:hypothetical protein EG328_009195 [Venturia inaequalis]|uniref:Transcription factor TFIIIC triple barrel domain-containing protein n=1 Tax=Venturia inaequalis TaxID=5025 RepID=A0A8H3V0A7_VENIN|nr:hypothetical protein EG328_009195 [Venturia inaequalis]KAE9979050.1 hypothetical protein EG327_007173 [Venturia inaequalis]RDI81723.1 hypothetical protein Vi05172_g8217 [Venturia inaequalis]